LIDSLMIVNKGKMQLKIQHIIITQILILVQ